MDTRNSKKTNIDEAHLMSLMAGEAKPVDAPEAKAPEPVAELRATMPKPAERGKGKRMLEGNYGDRFLQHHTMTKRGEKSIYIRQEYHERLCRIVQVIGGDRIPLYAFLDNILQHHFEIFEKAILQDFDNHTKPLF
ncbi:Protein of unknown function [Chitinophaga eiseniae]|uniref:Conjugal transfer protein TraB n=1 Tax=Chitinophaga eiseniae TaxID=634771 RepID=A0A1T4SYQ1_9BACT|nr:DUF3408 domain-containing protein [Chitinophaga eiseniae]SKA33051.1 Protein of unknown function [Chitinophaga eiseniae]